MIMEKIGQNLYGLTSPVVDLIASMFRLHSHEKLEERSAVRDYDGKEELIQWVQSTRKKLPSTLTKELQVFFDFESYIGLSMIRFAMEKKRTGNVSEFIDLLEKTTPQLLFRCFLNTGFVHGKVNNLDNSEEVFQFISSSNLPDIEKWKLTYLYMDLELTKKRFITLVRHCYEYYFHEEEEKIKTKQQTSLKQLTDSLTLNQRTQLKKIFPHTNKDLIEDEELTIILSPSIYYGSSSLTSHSESDFSYLYIYGISQPRTLSNGEMDDDQLISSFKIFADEKRIKMIRILTISPNYGYEIAQKLSLSNSTVSHHLSVLANHDLVTAKRKENRIYYELNKNRIVQLMETMNQALIK